jgi:hypothetical protein
MEMAATNGNKNKLKKQTNINTIGNYLHYVIDNIKTINLLLLVTPPNLQKHNKDKVTVTLSTPFPTIQRSQLKSTVETHPKQLMSSERS